MKNLIAVQSSPTGRRPGGGSTRTDVIIADRKSISKVTQPNVMVTLTPGGLPTVYPIIRPGGHADHGFPRFVKTELEGGGMPEDQLPCIRR